MDHEQFGYYKTGRLVAIRTRSGRDDYAFVPGSLPPAWELPASLWPMVSEARESLARLDGAARAFGYPSLLLRTAQRREALKSNTIEGTTVQPRELLRFEAGAVEATRGELEKRNDLQEVVACDRVLMLGVARTAAGAVFDLDFVRSLHRELMSVERGRDKQPGEFRDVQVFVGRYIPPPPEDLPCAMTNLESFLLTPRSADPLVSAFIAHYQFEAIHPFRDGNGRLGRVLLSLTAYRWLNLAEPWLLLSDCFDRNRSEYFQRLFDVSTDGRWEDWIRFCLMGTITQAAATLRRCERLDALRREYEAGAARLGGRMPAIIAGLFQNPVIEIAALSRSLGVTYPTAAKDIDRLVEIGILSELRTSRPRSFIAQEIFRVSYED